LTAKNPQKDETNLSNQKKRKTLTSKDQTEWSTWQPELSSRLCTGKSNNERDTSQMIEH
jgi:hypothetical protein